MRFEFRRGTPEDEVGETPPEDGSIGLGEQPRHLVDVGRKGAPVERLPRCVHVHPVFGPRARGLHVVEAVVAIFPNADLVGHHCGDHVAALERSRMLGEGVQAELGPMECAVMAVHEQPQERRRAGARRDPLPGRFCNQIDT